MRTVDRPAWTLTSRAHHIWEEDDVTVSQSDHVRLDAAWERIYSVPMPAPIETYDDGDVVFKLLPNSLVVRESYPGNSGIYAWPRLRDNDPVTIVLRCPDNVKGGERLIHTEVLGLLLLDGREGFDTKHDDRPAHLVTDHTVTWWCGHVDLHGREALTLLRAAQQADSTNERGEQEFAHHVRIS